MLLAGFYVFLCNAVQYFFYLLTLAVAERAAEEPKEKKRERERNVGPRCRDERRAINRGRDWRWFSLLYLTTQTI